jgi:hypothetical protein
MKNFNLAPIDAGRAGQCIQELKLRCPCSRNDAGAFLIAERTPERASGVIRCGLTQRKFVCKNFYSRLRHLVRFNLVIL